MSENRLDAADVLDWDHMCGIAEFVQRPKNRETAEDVINAVCGSLGADRMKLREFARQIGIKLERF